MFSFNANEDGVVGRQMTIDIKKYHKKFTTEDLEIAYQGFRENYRMCDLPDYFCISNNCIRKILNTIKKSGIDRSLYYYPNTNMIKRDDHNIGTNKVCAEQYSPEMEFMDKFIKKCDYWRSGQWLQRFAQ